MSTVLCLGDSCADVIIPYGDLLEHKDVRAYFECGGAGANSAAALGKLNVDTAFAGKAGKDLYGITMKKELETHFVDTTHFILAEDLVSTQVLVVIDENRDRHTFLMPKDEPSYLEIYKDDLDDIDLSDTEYILTNGMMLFRNPAAENITDFLIKAHEKGIKILLDINYRIETIGQDRTYLDKVVEISDHLLGSITDDFLPLTGKDTMDEAADALLKEGKTIVARDSSGSTVYTSGNRYHCDSFKVEVADTLGAGDAFNAGYIYGLVRGHDLRGSNIRGCAAAALCINKTGARNTPYESELLSFLIKRLISL